MIPLQHFLQDLPKDNSGNGHLRYSLITHGDSDLKTRAQILAACKADPVFWINCFCWTYDAKGDKFKELGWDSPHMPFITFDFQDEFIYELKAAIEDGENLLIEKSRDMGISWLVICIFLWFWLFQGAGNDFLLGSRKQQYVDERGNMSTLMQKARYILKRLPSWMLPAGFELGDQSPWDNHNRLINPVTECVIAGESNNVNFGTSGRVKAALYDEFAKWEHTDDAAWESATDTAGSKIAVSSAWGKDNKFYRLRNQEEGHIKVITLHWKLHPLKDDAWYEEECKTRSESDVASNLDIDYSASVKGKAFPNFDIKVQGLDYDPYDQGLPIMMECDFNIHPMSWNLAHEVKGEDYYFGEVVDEERTITAQHMAEFLERYKAHKNKVLYLFGDFSGSFGDTRGYESDYDIIKRMAKDLNWEVIDMTNVSNPSHRLSLELSAKRLSDWTMEGYHHVHFYHEGCPYLVKSLEQTRRKGDGVLKDGNEHSSDAFRYGQTTRHGTEIDEQEFGGVSRYG